jgi:hypothetical protein
MKTWLTCALVVLIAGAVAWPRSRAVSAQANAAVQIVPGGQRQAGKPGEKGATYYGIEAQATRSTTTFRDGHVAVSERGLIGDISTTLRDQAGNEQARLRLTRIDGARDLLRYDPSAGTPFQALSEPSTVKPTLDWAARQAYGLVRDGAANLVWDGGTMRPRNALPRDAESEIDAVETVWADGLVARLRRDIYPRRQIAPGRVVEGPVLVTELTQYDAPAGTGVWFERDRVFAYSLPGLVPGMVVIGPQELKKDYGGWPFTPDTTWLNLQMIASRHFKALAAKQGSVAKGCEPAAPSRLAQFFMPTLNANDVGCDGLHYLDGSLFRQCCDDHDRCYVKDGCTSRSWWMVWTSWACDMCNLAAVECFIAISNLDERCLNKAGCAG